LICIGSCAFAGLNVSTMPKIKADKRKRSLMGGNVAGPGRFSKTCIQYRRERYRLLGLTYQWWRSPEKSLFIHLKQ
jgi:hypothetical protein